MSWDGQSPTQQDRFHAKWMVIAAILGALAGASLQFLLARDVTDARLLEVRQELFKEQARSDNLEQQLRELRKISELRQGKESRAPSRLTSDDMPDRQLVPSVQTLDAAGGSGGAAESSKRRASNLVESHHEPEKSVSQYWHAVEARDYMAAWLLLSKGFKSKNHGGEFANYVHARQVMGLCSAVAEGLGLKEIHQGSAIVEGTVIFRAGSLCRSSKERFSFYLVRGTGQDWLIDRVLRR